MPITYTQAVYKDSISDTATEVLGHSCSFLGVIVTPTVSPDGDAIVTFRDGGASGNIIFKTNLGDAQADDSQSGILWSPIPGMGIRIDTSLWVESTMNTGGGALTRIAAVTVFYQ